MVKKSHGFRARTRKELRQKVGMRPTITMYMQEFKKNQKVIIIQEPSSHKGMPHPRFKGKVGRILERRGSSYILEIDDGGSTKKIISRPEHLRPF
jgi:large subunit ribosomal protein L21e